MHQLSLFKSFSPVSLVFLLQIFLSSPLPAMANENEISPAHLDEAAKILCQSLSAGESAKIAREAARTYLLSQVEDKSSLNAETIRQQLRPVVMKKCPLQAMKLIGQ